MEMREKIKRAQIILQNERFMRERVFKDKPPAMKKKVGEIDFVLKLIDDLGYVAGYLREDGTYAGEEEG